MQLIQIRNNEIERQKYFMFLTIKQRILKNIKDMKLDELIAVLRQRKFAKVWLYSRTVDKAIKNLRKNISVLKERKIQKLRVKFGALRIVNRMQKKLMARNGNGSTVEQRILNMIVKPAFKI